MCFLSTVLSLLLTFWIAKKYSLVAVDFMLPVTIAVRSVLTVLLENIMISNDLDCVNITIDIALRLARNMLTMSDVVMFWTNTYTMLFIAIPINALAQYNTRMLLSNTELEYCPATNKEKA